MRKAKMRKLKFKNSKIDLVRRSLVATRRRESRLTQDLLMLPHGSSPKVRHLLNNLCVRSDCRYLQVGAGPGVASLVAAMQGNDLLHATVFVEPGESLTFARDMCDKYAPGALVNMLDFDFRTVDSTALGTHDVYLYDGHQDAQSYRLALSHLAPALDDVFVLVVDDWNFRRTRLATRRILAELKWGVMFDVALPAHGGHDRRRWWNGLFVAVVDKRQAEILDMLRTRMSDNAAQRSLHKPLRELSGLTPAEAIKYDMFKRVKRVIGKLMMAG